MKWLIGASALIAAPAAAQTTPLFGSDEPIRLTISGPLTALARAAEKTDEPRDGVLKLAGSPEAYAIKLSPRGITRRRKDTCGFPPLRVEFPQKPAATSLFAGQRRLKLVTHCRSQEAFQQYLLLEYSAYRIFNLISPVSFRARLASIDYTEADGKPIATRWGFFIEDLDDAARRNGMAQARVGDRVAASQLQAKQAARVALFEYMIGNLDWSMRAGPPGEGCCHNGRLIVAPGSTALVPVPYDFDYSGLVNAPYAVPPDGFKVDSVRERAYQGYCRLNGDVVAAAAEFRALRPSIEGLFGQIAGMTDKTRSRARAYLAEFYSDIATNESLQAKVLKGCV